MNLPVSHVYMLWLFLIFLVSTVIDLNSSMLKKNNLTVGIYGIADIERRSYPVFTHDHNISVFNNGKLLHYIQLERITRRKYDNRLDEFLYQLLKSYDIVNKSMPTMVFVDNVVGRSFCSFHGDIRFEAPINDELHSCEEEGNLRWLGTEGKGYVVSHELAHLFSCIPFYGRFKENSLLIHFDGGASKSNFSVWRHDNGKIRLLDYHWDLKWLTGFFNANPLSFALTNGNIKNQNGVPGKLMGLAAYGNYREEIEAWLQEYQYFYDCWGKSKAMVEKINSDWNVNLRNLHPESRFLQDVAATMHQIYIRETVKIIRKWRNKTGTRFLYFSGGSALNICLNRFLIASGMFHEIFVPPCANDSGLSIGAGAYMEMAKNNTIQLISPFQQNWKLKDCKVSLNDEHIRQTASLIHAGKVIAICNGLAEVGPRALGNRSIVARADKPALSGKISMEMKKREWYRPVAPVMLEKNARYFTKVNRFSAISKYMLTEFFILPEHRNEISGAVHVDGTARIQVLFNQSDNPYLWKLLHVLDEEFGIRALINTSFNVAGEPLVHTTEEAISTAKNMGIKHLIMNGELHHL